MSIKVLKSSAGSGKTFALVLDYLKMALKNPPSIGIGNILALTFTNKAANEMKERIVLALVDFTNPEKRSNNIMFSLLLNDSDLQLNEDELINRSKQLLWQILHRYDRFSVSTIDRFNHQLIRTFALDLNLSQSFEVELDVNELLEESIQNLIDRSLNEPILKNYLVQFSLSKIAEDKSWRIEKEIFDYAKTILQETSQPFLLQLQELSLQDLESIKKEVLPKVKSFENRILKLANEGLNLIDSAGILPSDLYVGNRGGIFSYFKKRAGSNFFEINGVKLQAFLSGEKKYGGKASTYVKSQIDASFDRMVELHAAIESILEHESEHYFIEKGFLDTFFAVGLINEIQREFSRIKSEKNILPISEFNQLISGIIGNQEAPYVYERLGNSYKHFLIDEFQDTSSMQWKNLVPLFENSLSEGKQNLVVGDGKQSIYRWRGGDVEQFSNFPEIKSVNQTDVTYDKVSYLKQFVREQVLDTNYRSYKRVVDFNNALFSSMVEDQSELIKSIYSEHAQKSKYSIEEGWVTIDVFNDKEKSEGFTYDDFSFDRVENYISSARDSNYEWGDIAIIGRTNHHLSQLAEQLKAKGIPVLSEEALLLNNALEVRIVLSYLKLTQSPGNPHEQLKLLYRLKMFFNLDFDIHQYSKSIAANKSIENFEVLLSSLGFNTQILTNRKCDGFELLERCYVELNLADKPNDYLFAFTGAFNDFSKKNTASISAFLEWFEENKHKVSLSFSEGANAVRLLTIHKSKGLEFPVVIFPYADTLLKFSSQIWVALNGELATLPCWYFNMGKGLQNTRYNRQIEIENDYSTLDAINLMYVACTRAEQRLHITLSNSVRKKFNSILQPTLSKFSNNWVNDFEYSYGEATINKVEVSETKNTISFNSLHAFPEYDRFEYSGLLGYEETTNQSRFEGVALHDILSRIHTLDELEKPPFLKLDAVDFWNENKAKISRLLTHSSIKPFFNQPVNLVFNESEFINSSGELLRPDRVVMFKDFVGVLDYKTGEESAKHLKQVEAYKQVVSEVYQLPAKGFLVYFDLGKIVEVQ